MFGDCQFRNGIGVATPIDSGSGSPMVGFPPVGSVGLLKPSLSLRGRRQVATESQAPRLPFRCCSVPGLLDECQDGQVLRTLPPAARRAKMSSPKSGSCPNLKSSLAHGAMSHDSRIHRCYDPACFNTRTGPRRPSPPPGRWHLHPQPHVDPLGTARNVKAVTGKSQQAGVDHRGQQDSSRAAIRNTSDLQSADAPGHRDPE